MGGSKCLRHVLLNNIKDKCIDLKTCFKQQSTPMGFLPISNLKRLQISSSLKPNKILTDKQFDPIAVHKGVKGTGKYNFEGTKIQLPSKINFQLFEHIAQEYWDYQLPYFLKFGFPLDFPHESHSSANQYPDHVKKYLVTEKGYKAIFGPPSRTTLWRNYAYIPFHEQR